MRIIDKNTDYYDYLQNVYPDDSVVFDRTDSYILHKKDLCEYMYVFRQDNRLTKYYEYDIDTKAGKVYKVTKTKGGKI